MTLRLYNTLTRTKEEFVPLDPKNVRMYVCGPTVYDYAHIGNARPAIVFDVLFRLLRHIYGEDHVTYVRNVTDIDDKINARAAAEDISIRELTDNTSRVYAEDVAALGNLAPTHTPRATEHIPAMIAMIGTLMTQGFAYEASGHVLFDVSKKKDYGKLSRRPLDEMIAGARVDVAPYKKNPMDFVLWKPSDANTPGWDSPWSRGRPGWHIECSAMAGEYLGESFDIHGGGIDLLFPHHENEIAQSESAHRNHALAKVWMHNGHLQVEGGKMSKSLGNFVTIREILHEFSGDVPRLQMLATHYRSPIDWTWGGATEARFELFNWADFVEANAAQFDLAGTDREQDAELENALKDDLNTPLALARLRELFREAKRSSAAIPPLFRGIRLLGFQQLRKPGYFTGGVVSPSVNISDEQRQLRSRYARAFQLSTANGFARDAEEFQLKLNSMGFMAGLKTDGSAFTDLQNSSEANLDARIQTLVEARNAARKAKNFAESDRIRDELAAQGIVLKDNPDGTTAWEVKR
jgi:cysteinyl-tRNA synthetase